MGKTCLITKLFSEKEFQQVHRLDFRLDPTLADIFADTLNPQSLLENIEIRLNESINLNQDLIFFDEVGDCRKAVDSLKNFSEDLPYAFVCASGSNIGLLESFPVGAVQHLELFPLCFEKFLMAKQNAKLLESFWQRRDSKIVFEQLWLTLLDYFFVGGMQEAVVHWFGTRKNLSTRVNNVTQIHRELVIGYRQDFGKYTDKLHALHIDSVFTSVPRQLAACQDNSVQRFKFKGVVEKKQRYRDLRGPIDWLVIAKLVRKCYPIESKPTVPLQYQIRANIFKLFF